MRHATSEWNALGKWTGLTDVPLSEKGRAEAKEACKNLKDLTPFVVYTSTLSRAKETYEIVKKELGWSVAALENSALNERDYGSYTAKNKWEIKNEIGEEAFQKLRRGWDYPVPSGETLKDVYARIIPFFKETVEPVLKAGKDVMLVAHGNSLRALEKYLDHIDEKDVAAISIGVAGIHVYVLDDKLNVVSKESRGGNLHL
jgi:2,3-bisphosphoglycerate-dependent phosphoglycerate mutase